VQWRAEHRAARRNGTVHGGHLVIGNGLALLVLLHNLWLLVDLLQTIPTHPPLSLLDWRVDRRVSHE